MPLYEYRCEACRVQFAQLQPMSAPRNGIECPHCGSTQTRRLVSSFASQPASAGAKSARGAECLPSG